MLAAALALAPLLVRWLPDVVGWLGGDDAEEVATGVVNAVQAVAGSTDPTTVAAVIADPQRGADLARELAKISADREKVIEEQRTARLVAALADTASARQQTIILAQAGSPLAYGAAMVSGVVLALFSLMVIAEQFGWPPVGDGTKRLVEAALILVLGYWVGSSAGSAAKDARQSASATALASHDARMEENTPPADPPRNRLFGRRG
jgi:hypothetical protein